MKWYVKYEADRQLSTNGNKPCDIGYSFKLQEINLRMN